MTEEQKPLTWWTDPRVESERRNVLFIAIVLAVTLCVIVTLAFFSSKDEIPTPGSVSPAVTTQDAVRPSSPAPAEKADWTADVMANILSGDFAAGTKTLDEVELELCRLRGVISHRTGDEANAMAWFSRAVKSPFATSGDHINLATLFLLQGRAEDSIAHFDSARTKEPDNDYAANRYYLALLQTKDADRAKQEIRSAIASAPISGLQQAGVPAAVIEMRGGNTAKAAELLAATRTLLPPETFQALLTEPDLAAFSDVPELREFFGVRSTGSQPGSTGSETND
jgi:tetratricopeptide (TPR) repeat protein